MHINQIHQYETKNATNVNANAIIPVYDELINASTPKKEVHRDIPIITTIGNAKMPLKHFNILSI